MNENEEDGPGEGENIGEGDTGSIEEKMVRIIRAMAQKDGLVVAFSGGVDSTVLARLARDALGDRTVAVTADTESQPRREIQESRELTDLIGIEHLVIKHSELDKEWVVRNPEDRCYHCRKELSGLLKAVAREKEYSTVADGVNISDFDERRPGIRAADEEGIWHPFVEFQVDKEQIREMARLLDLPVHDKPAAACLSSRIPYGESITGEKLEQVERAEELIGNLGFSNVRLRHHGNLARIEVPEDEIFRFHEEGIRKRVVTGLRELGFNFVTLDLVGYRPGSLDEGREEE